MIKLVLANGQNVELGEGVELPLEPLVGIKVVLTRRSGLKVIATLPNVVGIVEE